MIATQVERLLGCSDHIRRSISVGIANRRICFGFDPVRVSNRRDGIRQLKGCRRIIAFRVSDHQSQLLAPLYDLLQSASFFSKA